MPMKNENGHWQSRNKKSSGSGNIPAKVLKPQRGAQFYSLVSYVWEEKEYQGSSETLHSWPSSRKGHIWFFVITNGSACYPLWGRVMVGDLVQYFPWTAAFWILVWMHQTSSLCSNSENIINHMAAFCDLTKIFDSINQEGIKSILHKFGQPKKFICILCRIMTAYK